MPHDGMDKVRAFRRTGALYYQLEKWERLQPADYVDMGLRWPPNPDNIRMRAVT